MVDYQMQNAICSQCGDKQNAQFLKAVLNRIILSNFAKYFSILRVKESNNHC